MIGALEIVMVVVFAYFVLYNLFTLTLLALSYGEMSWLVRGRQPGRGGLRPLSQRPGVSILVPAYNEEKLVVSTVGALLEQDYAPVEVVVVDDGSTDATFERLDAAFDLVALPLGGALPLESARVRSVHASRVAPALRVVRKENGGRADALNAGLGFARHELVAVTDADGILERDAVARVLRPFEEHPDDCLAAAGTIRVVNASSVVDGRVVEPRVAWSGLAATQVIEYLRGFLGTRIAWSRLNGLALVSGAFGLFRHDTLLAAGGFLRSSLGEDLEVTVRLHHELRPGWPTCRIAFVPDAVCWTQAPDTLAGLRTQRVRWQVGLLETIRLHIGVTGRRRFGALGLLAFPYAFLEAFAAMVEVAGYAVGITLVALEPSRWPYLVAFFGVTVLFGQLQSMMALLVEETGFRRYGRAGMTRLLAWSLLECFWYRPLLALWRTGATLGLLVGRRPGWGTIPRRVMGEAPAESVVPLTR